VATFYEIQLPTNIGVGSRGGPEFTTSIIVLGSGYEQRNIEWETARARYEIGTDKRTKSEIDIIRDFFYICKGKAYGFRFKDWDDYQGTGEILGTGDNIEKDFQLIKTYTYGIYSYVRTINKPVAATTVIYIDDVAQGSGWTINTVTGLVSFTAAPGVGKVVSADFEFDVPVRFDIDWLPPSFESPGVSLVESIPLVEVRL